MIVKSHREGIHMKAKQKQKLKKFTNFQRQTRELEPMKPEEHKYIKELLEISILTKDKKFVGVQKVLLLV